MTTEATETTTTAPATPTAGAPVEQPRDDLGRFIAVEKLADSVVLPSEPAPDAAAAEGQAAPTPDDKPDPRRERSRQRWQDMKARVREAESQAAYWQQQAQRNMQEASRPLDPMQFPSDAEYQAALAAQAMRRVTAQDHMATSEAIRGQAAATAQQAIQVQAEALRERVPDIGIIYADPAQGGPMISSAMAAAIHESENGALLAYHLAKNPHKAQAIYNLPPIAAARELGRLEASLSTPHRRISQAPQPVQTVSGGSGVSGKDPGSMSFSEYEKWRASGGG